MKLTFICVHNGCRSQMAEALAKYKAKELGLDIEVFFSRKRHFKRSKSTSHKT